ncbi:hypothetical protein [Flavobacterium piscisymbiosum]|uniref:Uncharacterized protein n=1 Tax=Flavobacterium piscisymbiosum TaxID=2893753 RepID=A0ABS8MDK7_9FLAO|nr:hypothetical protein [Flavobacterium sp. F-30]MCC9063598.1 hypothetical protein [Flavobacterium sp. F-30]
MTPRIKYDKIVDFSTSITINHQNLLDSFQGYFLLGNTISHAVLSQINNYKFYTYKGRSQKNEVLDSFNSLNRESVHPFILLSSGELRYVKILSFSFNNEMEFEMVLEPQPRLSRLSWHEFSQQEDFDIMGNQFVVSGLDLLKQQFSITSNTSKGEIMGGHSFGTFIKAIDQNQIFSTNEKILLMVFEIIENTLKKEILHDDQYYPAIANLENYEQISLVNYSPNHEIEFSLNTLITGHGRFVYPDLKIDLK